MNTKVERYKEIDLEALEAVKNSPSKSLYFAELAKIVQDPVKLHKVLKKLVARNLLAERSDFNGSNYFICETNRELNIVRVVCPVCKTVRRTHRDNQHTIHCSNPDCRMPSGRHRNFWLVNIDHLRKGNIRRINNVN